ncbi:hypothetical protein LUZ60_011967 [Juncus effusus]|nr:hypothetical protein LUZ60_011967 [Juncus effusus]
MADSISLLRNEYWVLRHGRSIPNENGLIVSSLENGVRGEFGLAAQGVDQARLAGQLFHTELKEKNVSLDRVRIFYSPFARTIDTAKQVAAVLGIPFESSACKSVVEIRERYFGPTLELQSHDKYAEIWALDEKDPFVGPEGGDSVADVASRLSTTLISIETTFKGCAVLIVSHGDTLQILQTLIHSLKENPNLLKEDDFGSSKENPNLLKEDDFDSSKQNPNLLKDEDFESRIKRVMMVRSVLARHRKFALLTGELRPII